MYTALTTTLRQLSEQYSSVKIWLIHLWWWLMYHPGFNEFSNQQMTNIHLIFLCGQELWHCQFTAVICPSSSGPPYRRLLSQFPLLGLVGLYSAWYHEKSCLFPRPVFAIPLWFIERYRPSHPIFPVQLTATILTYV